MNNQTETTEQKQTVITPATESHQSHNSFDELVNVAMSQTKDAIKSIQAGAHALDIERIAKLNERGLIPQWKTLIDNNKITFKKIHDIITSLPFCDEEDEARRNSKLKARNKKNLSSVTMPLSAFTKHLQDEYGFKKRVKK